MHNCACSGNCGRQKLRTESGDGGIQNCPCSEDGGRQKLRTWNEDSGMRHKCAGSKGGRQKWRPWSEDSGVQNCADNEDGRLKWTTWSEESVQAVRKVCRQWGKCAGSEDCSRQKWRTWSEDSGMQDYWGRGWCIWRQAKLKSMKWKQWQVDLRRQCGCGKFCDFRFSLLLLKQYILYTVHPKRNIYWQRLTNHIQFRTIYY